ncbi:MAG: hypothetical protein NTW86_15030 [Candidatus Sumerlaeota bacterium]|nr:hypothetical protein [Candidatus Sumerlaeota bacterium]
MVVRRFPALFFLFGLPLFVRGQSTPPAIDGALPPPLPLLPATNWWNANVSQAPLDPHSQQIIDFINNGGNRPLHPDWGAAPYGIPYCTVAGDQPLANVVFQYDDESDHAAPGRPPGYPIPTEAKTQAGWIEGCVAGGGASGDRHMLIVDCDHRILFELYALHWVASRNRWEAGSGAIWPLDDNTRRPDTWTSADAAGLAILPGLVRYDEVYGPDPIRHAFRFTVRDSAGYCVYPASHVAGGNPSAPPLGARLRLKAGVDISTFDPHVQKIFQAMKTYGLILADNGSDMYITGSYDPRWDMDVYVPAFRGLHASDFEAIQLGWKPSSAASQARLWTQCP